MRSSSSGLIALLAIAEVILITVTWPLWFSKTDFPQVALVSSASSIPGFIHQGLSALLVITCLVTAARQVLHLRKPVFQDAADKPSTFDQLRDPKLSAVVLFCAVALAVLDQHRLQPWHWLMILLFTEWLLLDLPDFRKAAAATFASIYLFAALSRFGPDMDSGMSRQILSAILNAAGVNTIKPGSDLFFVLATAMSIMEFAIGIGLLVNKTRRLATLVAMLLHATLILCLSPLGLNHHLGVLVWNGFLLVAVMFLFWPKGGDASKTSWKGRLAMATVLLIPASGLFGIADNWLSWQVYSPRPEVLKLTVHEDSAKFLPPSLQAFVQPPQLLRSDCPIRLDRWSLQQKLVPGYPEDRFQIAVAKQVVQYAVSKGAERSAFAATMESAVTFPWWRRQTKKIDL